MSDFLSKFSGDRYQKLLDEEEQEKEPSSRTDVPTVQPNTKQTQPMPTTKQTTTSSAEHSHRSNRQTTQQDHAVKGPTDASVARLTKIKRAYVGDRFRQEENHTQTLERDVRATTKRNRRDDFIEETEFDPSYRKRKRKKQLLIVSSIVGSLLLIAFVFYQLTHVSLPDFTDKPLTELREWGEKHNIDFEIEQVYDLEHETNTIVSQKIPAGQMVRKGSKIDVVASLGPDPNEVIPLPDFSTMTYSQAQTWIDEHKAINLKLQQQYSATVAQGKFIKIDLLANTHSQDYKRGDKATVYYSRGEEQVEKNIDVPDFATKTKVDVESWARSNNVTVTFVDKANSSMAAGTVMSQSIAPGTKISKKDPFEVTISAGKGVAVPDFNFVTIEAASTVTGLTVLVRQEYSNSVPYGKLISQSQAAGTELTEKDDRNVVVIYSAGTPYLRDLRGKNEGDLQKYFYEEFRAKGAEVYYTTYYVDSSLPRGTVVEQSAYETEITVQYTVRLGVSNGRLYNSEPVIPEAEEESTTSRSNVSSDEG